MIVGSLPKLAPRMRDVIRVLERIVLVVVHGNIEDIVAIPISINKLILELLYINLVDRMHKKQSL